MDDFNNDILDGARTAFIDENFESSNYMKPVSYVYNCKILAGESQYKPFLFSVFHIIQNPCLLKETKILRQILKQSTIVLHENATVVTFLWSAISLQSTHWQPTVRWTVGFG